jgi:hypothetical protein
MGRSSDAGKSRTIFSDVYLGSDSIRCRDAVPMVEHEKFTAA